MEFSCLGIDFGTSNTLIAGWNEYIQAAELIALPEYSRAIFQEAEIVPIIPSLIHYSPEGRIWIGQQVHQLSQAASRRTLRWMKQYILNRSPIQIRLDDRTVTPIQAAQDFLSTLFTFLQEEQAIHPKKVAFSVPVEAFENYTNWLNTLAEKVHLPETLLIDEPVAAAIGYGIQVKPGTILFIFDFGGGTMHAALVLIEKEAPGKNKPFCRVLGKAGKNIGGTRIDQWLYQELLKRCNLSEDQPAVRQTSNQILAACEKLKENLSQSEKASTGEIVLPGNHSIQPTLCRQEFEEILERNHLFDEISLLFRSVINQAYERGYAREDIQFVLMIGGSALIPSVQKHVQEFFGSIPVHINRPLDAVARGAALYAAGTGILDHIRHDYAIRFYDSKSRQYAFHKIVSSGTPYPTSQPVSRLTVKATHQGQRKLGLAIFQIRNQKEDESLQEHIELIFDPQGSARLVVIPAGQVHQRNYFFVNEQNPTFLTALPPAEPDTPRFEVAFYVDSQKRLTITARDLQSGVIIMENQPVIRLT